MSEEVARVTLTAPAYTLEEGATIQLSVELLDGAGASVDAEVAWSSSDAGIVSVDAAGQLVAHHEGAATVTAKAGSRSASAYFVVHGTVRTVAIERETDRLQIGMRTQLHARAQCACGRDLRRPLLWSSSDRGVVFVDQLGQAIAVGPGTATIRVESDGVVGAVVFVVEAAAGIVELDPADLRLRIGERVQVQARVRGGDGGELNRPVTWVSMDPTRATVDGAGFVTALAAGPVVIIAQAEEARGVLVVIVEEPVATIEPEQARLRIRLNEQAQIRVRLRDRLGRELMVPVTWTSAAPAIATVDQAGYVRGLAEGTAIIEAAADGARARIEIVVEPPTGAIVLLPSRVEVLLGGHLAIQTELRTADGRLLDRRPAFASADPSVAVVSETGVVSGLRVGQTTVTATSDGVTATVPVRVIGVVASVSVTPPAATLVVGATLQLTAALLDAGGHAVSRPTTWTSSALGVATVSATGLVTAVGAGTATITVQSDGRTSAATIVVQAAPGGGHGGIHSIVVGPSGPSVQVGGSVQLTAATLDDQGADLHLPVTWTSADPSIATVDATGRVTGVAQGHVDIIASAGSVTGQVGVTVQPSQGGGGGGEEEGLGNNLSWPLIFAEGIGVTGQPVAIDPGIRPTTEEGITVTALPFFWTGNFKDYMGTYYLQGTSNTWRAEWLDGSTMGRQNVLVDWGDNLIAHSYSTHATIRVEVALYALTGQMQGFNMFVLSGTGIDEVQGTDGTIGLFTPQVYTVSPRLIIEKLDDTTMQPIAEVFNGAVADGLGQDGPGYYGAEINKAGKVVYGYNLYIKDITTLPANVHKYGWWRLTFVIDPVADLGGVAVPANVFLAQLAEEGEGEDEEEGGAPASHQPQLDPSGTKSWIDIYVKSASGGGGGGGGGHTGGGDHTSGTP